MTLAPGTRLGPYEILAPLGAGGMGEVYRARDSRLQRAVALKVVPDSLARDPEALNRFQREALTLAAMSHPNLVAIFDVGREGDVSYLVMELLEGGTLRHHMREGPLPEKAAIDLARQIARGLAAAHGRAIVHRDLKPENLFIAREGLLKILDFGLAARAETVGPDPSLSPTLTRQTAPGMVVGTAGYMSPEQVRGRKTDHRSDIFSLGAILYEMVGGRRAFAGDTSADTMSAILREQPPDLGSQASSPGLRRLISRCLAKDPADRFQSAGDVEFALDALDSSASDGRKAVHLAEPRSIAVLPFVNMSPDPDTEYFSDGVTEEVINALTQLPGVLVAARTSSFAFKGKNLDLRTIAESLNVSIVLEGSVRRAGTRLRITAQLVRVEDGHLLWSERYDREFSDVFAIQDDIAHSIAGRLTVTLASDAAAPTERSAQDAAAYDLYLKGRYFFNRRAAPQAIAEFEKAISLDPNFAPAYTGLSDSYGIHAYYGGVDTRVAYARARAATEAARRLAPESAEVNLSTAILEHYFGWNFEREEQQLSMALQRSPNVAAPYYWLSLCHGLRGRLDRALPLARQAALVEPLSPYPLTAAGYSLLTAGRFDEALGAFRQALEIEPGSALVLSGISLSEQGLGDHDAAVATVERLVAISERRSSFGLGALALAYARAGREQPARRVVAELDDLSTREYVAPIHVAPALLHLGDGEAAFGAFERACEQRNALAWWWTLHSPASEALRQHARFGALAARILPSD
jgi:eukaryotic-like serine/threonine-protein kinase